MLTGTLSSRAMADEIDYKLIGDDLEAVIIITVDANDG